MPMRKRAKRRELRCRKEEKEIRRASTLRYQWSEKHKRYIRRCVRSVYNIAEGAVRAGKTVDNVYAFAHELKTHPDKMHLATGSTGANAKLNIGDCNGLGLEYIFAGQCKWGKYKGNECLIINGPDTNNQDKIVIFAGAALASSYKKIRGNSFGMWIATEINIHHDNTIKEAFNRTLASHRRKFFWDLNPDHPNAPIYTDYIDKYVEMDKTGELLGGVNYQQFTITDNVNIDEQARKEFISQYVPGSIWYNRDILGQRSIAEGLIYKTLAGEISLPAGQKKPHSITLDEAKAVQFGKIIVGVDFGGNGSGHAFIATGISKDFQQLYSLRSRRYVEGKRDPDNPSRTIRDVSSQQLCELFHQFVLWVLAVFGRVDIVYVDSAEQVLKRDFQNVLRSHKLGNIPVADARKLYINDRIFCLDILSANDRYWYVESECGSLMAAIASAIWDKSQPTKNERLDDGTSDIDSLDAFEYTFERFIPRLLRSFGYKPGQN